MKKKPFLLLEVLLALFLVSMAAAPLATAPLVACRAEIKQLEAMEKERLANWTFSEVSEQLLKGKIAWKQIPAEKNKSGTFSLPTAKICLPGWREKTISRSFVLECKEEKAVPDKEINRLLDVKIRLDESEYKFRTVVTFHSVNNFFD